MTSIDEVISVSYQCMTCDGKYTKKYDPPITWELYTEYRDRRDSDAFLCEKCNTPCRPIAYFEEGQTKQPANAPSASGSGLNEQSKSVIEMKKVKEGPVKGCGRVVAVGEQYQAVSQISALCDGLVPCACDALEDEHERRCGYKLRIDFTVENSRPPTPVILSIFDTGSGKPQICPRCKTTNNFQAKMEYRRAKLIRLQDIDNRTDNARQDVILYDDMVENLAYNEIIEVEGSMFVERKPGSSKNSMMDNILHTTSIKYREDKKVTITDEDKILFHRWKEICDKAFLREVEALDRFKRNAKDHNCAICHQLAGKITPLTFIERQSAAMASNVIGHIPARQGILRTLVGATRRGTNTELGKIHTLFVGDKGTAKTKAARQGEQIHPNSAHVTATHASGKAVTGIVDAESKMLVLGILPASDIVVIDEIDKLPAEEQSRLLGVLEEQHFAKDAYGLHYEIDTNVGVIATANPTNTSWIDPHRVSKDEIGLIETLKDRFTQIFTFRDDNDTVEKRKAFAEKFTAIRKRSPPNYTFFRKFWIYVSSLRPEISPDAERMLREFWASQNMGVIGLMDNRFLVHMFKMSEAQAKLNLSEEVNEDIAAETQTAIKVMLLHYAENVKVSLKPSEITFNTFLDILENTKAGIALEELCRMAINEDPQIAEYLGSIHTQRDNIKLRRMVDRILKSEKVKKTHEKPIVLQWFEGKTVCDPCDPCDTETEPSNVEKTMNSCEENSGFNATTGPEMGSHISHISHSNRDQTLKPPVMVTCPTCPYTTDAYSMKFHQCEATR